ncbi:MAG: cell division ATPase MinD [Candidatus Hadarchaeales archaeon]
MSRIIAFIGSKGGTGKTTVVANLGVAMARLGRKIVLLDADVMMADLAILLGVEDHKVTLHDVLAGEAPIRKAIASGPEGVKVVPGGVSMEGIRKAKLEGIKNVVQQLSKMFQFVFIDVPSGLDRDAITAMSQAKEAVIVVTPDLAAVSNAIKTKLVAEKLGLKSIGAIVTRATETGLDIPPREISMILDIPILGVIPEDRAVRQSIALGEPVITKAPQSLAAREFKMLAFQFKVTPSS